MPFSFLSYPLDLLGTAGTNHITNETRAFVTAADRHFVPAAGPFYASSMIIRHGTTNTVLFPNTHYKLLHTHLEGTLASGKTVVAVVHIVDTSIPSISMDYRAIGGSFAETASVIAQNLQDNPPIGKTVWGQIIGQPPQYAPAEHLHNADEIYGLGDVVAALEHLRMAILQNDAMAIDAIYQYINVRLSNENYVTQDQLVNSVGGSAKIRVYTTAATLRAVTDVSTHQDYLYVLVGEGSANDKHGRLYYWDPACELLEDASLNVVKPDNVSSAVAGRFVSILRVEGDLASEITTRQSAVSALQTALSNEITARYNADTVLTNAIAALQSDLLAKASTAALTAEISARQNADTALSNSITSAVNTVTGLVNQEATNRADADTALQNNINSEATARQTGDQNLQNQIDALSGAAGGFATTTQLNTEITDRQNAISAEATALSNEVTARQNADLALLSSMAGMESAAQLVVGGNINPEIRLITKKPGIWINGAFRMGTAVQVMAAVPANTFYYVYAYWDGTDIQLYYTLTSYVSEPNGVKAFVKDGDPTRTLVGLYYRDNDNNHYVRSAYGDRRQYVRAFDPEDFPASPYTAVCLDPLGSYPFNCTTLAAEYDNPSPTSDLADFEMPVLFFSNETMNVRWRLHFRYTTITGTADGMIRFVVGTPATGFLPYMDIDIMDGDGGRVNVVTAEGHFLIGPGFSGGGVKLIRIRAARNHDPDGGQGAGNYIIPKLNTAIVEKSTYADKVSVVDTSTADTPVYIPNNNRSFIQLIYDEPSHFFFLTPNY